jgi:hypothetical protein
VGYGRAIRSNGIPLWWRTTFSRAPWSLARADGASGGSQRHVQRHGGANERLQRLLVDRVALVEIDGAPHIAFEALLLVVMVVVAFFMVVGGLLCAEAGP